MLDAGDETEERPGCRAAASGSDSEAQAAGKLVVYKVSSEERPALSVLKTRLREIPRGISHGSFYKGQARAYAPGPIAGRAVMSVEVR